MKLRQVILLILSGMLLGCNAAGVQPSEPSAPAPVTTQDVQPESAKQVGESVELLTNRMTAVQEQLLNVRSQSARQLEQLQSIQLQLQALSLRLKNTPTSAPTPDGGAQQPAEQELSLLLDQMARMASDIALQLQDGNYRFVSCYTQSGQWILVRYDRYSGESWLADEGQWILLDELDGRSPSVYEVSVQRADKDSKGFVAARLDRQTGQTWWLKQNSWQLLE